MDTIFVGKNMEKWTMNQMEYGGETVAQKITHDHNIIFHSISDNYNPIIINKLLLSTLITHLSMVVYKIWWSYCYQ